jgi:glycosyltransferase involved in cell wall biosynthesis
MRVIDEAREDAGSCMEVEETVRRPRVVFVDDQTGFPNGTAAANRLRHLARGVAGRGLRATVLLTKPSEAAEKPRNLEARGEYQGVEFEYTCGTTIRSASFARRRLHGARGRLVALWRLARASREPDGCVLYLFTETPALCLLLHLAARLLKVPVLADACEWAPATNWGTPAKAFYLKHLRYRLSDGVVCITSFLVDKARIHGARSTVRLPITVDPDEFTTPGTGIAAAGPAFPYLLWCGQLDAYIESVADMLKAFSFVCRERPELVLMLAGPCAQPQAGRISRLKAEYGIPDAQVRLLGYIDRNTLCALCSGAAALLAPLEADVRSEARFPIKIGEYLMSGRPLIVGGIGDIPGYFEDRVTALVYKPGDLDSMAERIAWVADNPGRADQIGRAGRILGEREFDYRRLGKTLSEFILKLAA